MSEKIYELLLGLKDSMASNHNEIAHEMSSIKLNMQRNTDSLVHHEERTSLLHEEVGILRQSHQELKKFIEIIQDREQNRKQSKKEKFAFWLKILAAFAQLATVGSFVAYVFLTK